MANDPCFSFLDIEWGEGISEATLGWNGLPETEGDVMNGLIANAAALIAAMASCGAAGQVPEASQPFRVSMSVSPFTELVFKLGLTLTDGAVHAQDAETLQKLFVAHGANEVYARIATRKTYSGGGGDHSLERGLERARLAKKLDLPFNPELGLFAVYGDITHQPGPDFSEYPEIEIPGPWETLTLEQMLPALRAYGGLVAQMILDTGVAVRIWDIGNEIEWGFAGVAPQPFPGAGAGEAGAADWYRPPDGVDPEIGKMSFMELAKMPQEQRIAWLEEHVWPYESRMLAAVAEGIRSVYADARFSTHVSGNGAVQPAESLAFYRAMAKGGFHPNELGFSFYPSASASPPDRLKAFRETVAAMREEFGKPVFIAEFGYPAKPMTVGPFADWNYHAGPYAVSPQGQADLMRDLASWGKTAGLSGIRPWGPDFPVPGWEPMALFGATGNQAVARPSLDAIAQGLASPNPNALESAADGSDK